MDRATPYLELGEPIGGIVPIKLERDSVRANERTYRVRCAHCKMIYELTQYQISARVRLGIERCTSCKKRRSGRQSGDERIRGARTLIDNMPPVMPSKPLADAEIDAMLGRVFPWAA